MKLRSVSRADAERVFLDQDSIVRAWGDAHATKNSRNDKTGR